MFNRWVDGSYGLKILTSVFCFSSIVIMKKIRMVWNSANANGMCISFNE